MLPPTKKYHQKNLHSKMQNKLACPDGFEQALPLEKNAPQCPFDKGTCGQKLFGQFFLQRNFPLSAIGNMVHRQQRVESLSITCFANNRSTPDLIPLVNRAENNIISW